MQHIDSVWFKLISDLMTYGVDVEPRGKKTKELPAYTSVVDMSDPVLTVPERKLGYKFMAAEAHWILSGDNRVVTIAPFAKHISNFSDDGVRFFGAYGPKVMEQLSYVVDCLWNDRDSRQAVMTIWRERPGPTKDVPCTIALQFTVRDGRVNCHATMRSSDAWLGWPYDVFNFSMIAWAVMLELRAKCNYSPDQLTVGSLYLTAASQHLYEPQFKECEDILDSRLGPNSPAESKILEINKARVSPIWGKFQDFSVASHLELLVALNEMRAVGVDKALKR